MTISLKTFTGIMSALVIVHVVVPYIVSMGVWEPLFWIATSLTALGATLIYFREEGGEG